MIKSRNIGFKGFVKNLKKLLIKECQKQCTHSESLETASHLLGYKNYNLYNAENKDFSERISLITSQLKKIEKKISVGSNESIGLVRDVIVNELNIRYKSKFDKFGRYLNFKLPISFDDVKKFKDAKVIIVEKEYFGSIRSTDKETMLIKYSYNEDDIPIVDGGSLKELEQFAEGFRTKPLTRHSLTANVNIFMKNKSTQKYDEVHIIIASSDCAGSLVLKAEDDNYSNYYEFHHNGNLYQEDNMSHENLKKLAIELNLSNEYVFTEYLKNYETETKKENKTMRDEWLPEELNMCLFRWIIETSVRGFFDAVTDVANMITDYEEYDLLYDIREDFYLAHKEDIKKENPIKLDVYSFDIETNIKRRDSF